MGLKEQCRESGEGYYTLDVGRTVPARLFLNEKLYAESEEGLHAQIKAVAELPGVLNIFRILKVGL